MDDDLTALTRDELVAEVRRLRAGIRQRHDRSGQDLYWQQRAALEASLATYVHVPADSANQTHHAPDRAVFQSHLAQAARMFAALRGDRPIEALMAIVAEERRSYGWGYLSDESGRRAEQAFHEFALLVEKRTI